MKKLFIVTTLTIKVLLLQVQGQSDVTTPGDSITGGQKIGGVFVPATQGTPVSNANMFPANAGPPGAIDNNVDSKYRNFGEVMTGFVVTPSFNSGSFGTIVTQIRFATALDAPERDPLTYTLEGTNGNILTGTYTLIASGSTGLETDPGRGIGGTLQTFASVGSFLSYRVIFPTVRNSATADSMQVSEVQIIGVAGVPEPSISALLGLSALGLMGARRRRR